mmetsp:Transcript_99050/g.171677  ORF Transcript_99050/g.171677 Transcript_99050/m.171677 type:complete len:518 (+) Transcript_99050:80-1633(+)
MPSMDSETIEGSSSLRSHTRSRSPINKRRQATPELACVPEIRVDTASGTSFESEAQIKGDIEHLPEIKVAEDEVWERMIYDSTGQDVETAIETKSEQAQQEGDEVAGETAKQSEMMSSMEGKTFIMRNMDLNEGGMKWISFRNMDKILRGGYERSSAMRVKLFQVPDQVNTYNMKCSSHGNDHWISFSWKGNWLYARYTNLSDAMPVKLFPTAEHGVFNMMNMWPDDERRGKWIGFQSGTIMLRAAYSAIADAMPVQLVEEICHFHTMTNIWVSRLSGQQFEVDVDKGETVVDVKRRIQKEQGYDYREIQLILCGEVLDNMDVLSNTSVKDDGLMLILRRGTMELHLTSISDDTQWHKRHKYALRSDALKCDVEKIEVTVGNFADQGWGGCQAELWIYLHDPANKDAQVACLKLFGPLRTSAYDERKHGRSPSCTIGLEEEVVALARPGMVYKLRYKMGGGGGHSIKVTDWRCKIFPQDRSTDEVSITVTGNVSLCNRSRLGGDRTTGKWELDELPY